MATAGDRQAAHFYWRKLTQCIQTGQSTSCCAHSTKHIQRNDIPVVVDFWAAWCGPCKSMAPVYERAAAEFKPEVRFLKVDTEAAPGLAAEFNIFAIPTLMLFRNGRVAAQQAGALDGQRLRPWIQGHIG
jgi:thioredoxin 2